MRKTLRWLAAAALALALSGCDRDQDGREELVSYSVPPERVEAVVEALSRVLAGTPPAGRASAGVAGEVIVLAPRHLQASIRQTIEKQLAGMEADTSAPEPMEFRLWVVQATAGEGSSDVPGLLEEVMAEYSRQQGPHRYRLIDQAAIALVSSVERRSVALSTRRGLGVRADALPSGGMHRLRVDLFPDGRSGDSLLDLSGIEADLLLRSGEFVVISRYTGVDHEAGSRFVVVQLLGRDG